MPAAWVSAAVGVYSALSSDSGGGSQSAGQATQQAVQAADPFASQRGMYQQALARLMGMSSPTGYGGSSPASAYPPNYQGATGPNGFGGGMASFTGHEAPNGIGSGGGYIYRPGLGAPSTGTGTLTTGTPTTVGGLSTAQGASGPGFMPSDPSYGFRLQSGSEAIQRAMGSKGLNGSGGMMAALMQYGQNLASTEYQNEFSRLAILSGAESGSPAAAGQLGLQGQQMQSNADAATLAQWNSWLQPAAKAVGGWINSTNSGSSGGGGDGGAGSSGGGNSYSDPFTSSSSYA